ncbi:MAG: periplasmic sensor signal transduction histidine kinase [Acidobacteria bacterium]|nr:periplasmic sensor signal transduction histidine kinase [Acidobacteriota bacterium]
MASSSIGRKLGWLSVLSSGSAILAASLALLFFQLQEVRSNLLRRLGTITELIAFNTAPAVDFNDPEAARAILGSLKVRPEITGAGIIVKGHLFAVYRGPGGQPRLDGDLPQITNGYRFTDRDLTVFRPIVSEGRPLGTLFIVSSFRDIERTWRRFAAITCAVAIPALMIALLISRLPRRAISRPILNLASLAVAVSDRGEYSVRAPVGQSAAEIEQLVSTFNQMLSEIQRQHREIDGARVMLEKRVAERTWQLELRGAQLEMQGRELAAANKELESFSYSVSHDLRAPLRAIDGFCQALLADQSDRALDSRGKRYLDHVCAGTKRMNVLIDDMLHLARVSRSALERTEIDVTDLADEVARELARRNPDRTVRCLIHAGMRASADAHLLTIVFENLLGNAWKFTGKRAEAEVEVGESANGEEPVFYVRDNGAGFEMANAERLFSPFQRLHTEAEFEGTGIGLATVKRIIVRHGGAIWAEAVEGEGATFYFTLGGTSKVDARTPDLQSAAAGPLDRAMP